MADAEGPNVYTVLAAGWSRRCRLFCRFVIVRVTPACQAHYVTCCILPEACCKSRAGPTCSSALLNTEH